jgi:methylglutaconyl-CoA hydratase
MSDQLMELEFTHDGNVAWIWLNRPKVHNAINRDLLDSLTATLHALPKQEPARLYVLGGRGPSFCAGVDLVEMKASGSATREENLRAARRTGGLFAAIAECPHPVIARVHGNVFGGGVGMVAASDIAIGAADSTFAISETRLGIIPGLISPYLLRRMGDGRARPLMLSGERFDGTRAHELGLLQKVAASQDLDGALDSLIAELLKAGPEAQTRTKEVLRFNANNSMSNVMERVPEMLADARSGDEAREGFDAFFEKRKPRWIPQLEKAKDGSG